jgi:Prealbumin-like fold domain
VRTRTGAAGNILRPFALISALALLVGVAGTTLAVDPDYATVTGYAPATEDNNHAETWGDNCAALPGGNVDSFVLPALDEGLVYSLVIVKAGSDANGNNTLFGNPSAGQTVWADSNENGDFDPGGQGGDKQISHMIACTEEAGDDASLNVKKTDEGGHPLAGAVFTVEGMEGTFTTGDNGKFCITGLPNDSQLLVTEIQAPPGYQLADPASQLVEVDDDGDCNSASATFVNALATATPTPTPTPEGSVAGGTSSPTPEGSVQGGTGTPEPSQPDTAMGMSGGPSPVPTIAFGLILLGALGALAWANVKSARSRA